MTSARHVTGEELLASYNSGRRDFSRSTFDGLNLPFADLSGANFDGCVFSESILGGAKFDGCSFRASRFYHCNCLHNSFIGADFSFALLEDSAFGRSDFFNAKFFCSLLQGGFPGAFFVGASMDTCVTLSCRFNGAVFGQNDIKRTFFVHSDFIDISLMSPSSIDSATVSNSLNFNLVLLNDIRAKREELDDFPRWEGDVLQSRNTMVDFFLYSGVSRSLVDSYAQLTDPVAGWRRYAPVFISHSSHDQEFSVKLRSSLSARGLETWYAPTSMRGGSTILDQITAAVGRETRMVVVLSESSLSSSWVMTELRNAISVERTSGVRNIFLAGTAAPEATDTLIAAAEQTHPDVVAYLRRQQILDFSRWRDDTELARSASALAASLATAE
jgi:uncharacterized protein YjbI with pentapeptide repeats